MAGGRQTGRAAKKQPANKQSHPGPGGRMGPIKYINLFSKQFEEEEANKLARQARVSNARRFIRDLYSHLESFFKELLQEIGSNPVPSVRGRLLALHAGKGEEVVKSISMEDVLKAGSHEELLRNLVETMLQGVLMEQSASKMMKRVCTTVAPVDTKNAASGLSKARAEVEPFIELRHTLTHAHGIIKTDPKKEVLLKQYGHLFFTCINEGSSVTQTIKDAYDQRLAAGTLPQTFMIQSTRQTVVDALRVYTQFSQELDAATTNNGLITPLDFHMDMIEGLQY